VLTGLPVIAMMLGAVAVLLGISAIVRRWEMPVRTATLDAVAALPTGTDIIGAIGHRRTLDPSSRNLVAAS
jgi:hypothetical protein